MTDDGSRIFGFGRSQTTIVAPDRKVQVRMSSGKIYGPYTRDEVLGFIREGRIQGEESMLVDGESKWRPISSDTEFFDLLQEVLLGVPGSKPPAAPEAGAPAVTNKAGAERTHIVPKTPKSPKKSKSPKAAAQPPFPAPSPAPKFAAPSGSACPPPEAPVTQGAWSTASENAPSASPAPVLAKPKSILPWILLGGLAVGVLVVVVGRGDLDSSSGAKTVSVADTGIAYLRPLHLLLGSRDFEIPPIPGTVRGVPSWNLVEAEGLHHWLADLNEALAETDPKILELASHWGRIAWDTMWIAACLEAVSPLAAETLNQKSRAIFDELRTKKLVSPAIQALFKGARDLIEGRFAEAIPSLAAAGDSSLARALTDQAAWMNWVSLGLNGSYHPLPAGTDLDNLVLDLSAKGRAALVTKVADIGPWLVQLAYEDPQSFQLWFLSALANAKVGRVQNAQRFYLATMATMSLYPRSYQAMAWKTYEVFLNNYARQETAEAAARNLEALKQGRIESKRWWDFESEGLSASTIVQEILSRADKGTIAASDLALLEVLGSVIPEGSRALLTAAEHWAFDGNFTKALQVFRMILKTDPRNSRALGGVVWAAAELYRFDEALDALDRLAQAVSSTPEDLKYSGVLHSAARDPDRAVQDLGSYLRQLPQDGWGHYFLARHHLSQKKNVDCLKSATLAYNHASGELRTRAQTLLFRCSILANIDPKNSLAQLKALTEAEPASVSLRLAYIDGLVGMDLVTEAVAFARASVQAFPRSYELRVKLGDLYAQQRNYDLAVAFYSRAGKDRPRAAEGRVKIGRVFEQEKRFLEAAQAYEAAGRAEPSYPEVWLLAARAYDRAGHVEAAAAMFKREIAARPAVINSFIEASEFLLKINAPQEVPKLFQQFSSDFQGDPRVMTRLSQAYLAIKDFANARSYAASALKANPKIAEPYYVLGVVFEEEAHYSEAKKYYELYLELMPAAPDAGELRRKIVRPPFTIE